MTMYHAVMIDETGCEFGTSVEASSRSEAYERLRDDYPESRCDQLESPEDTLERERRMYLEIERELYGEDDFDDETDEERAERHQRLAEAGEED